MLLDFVTGTPIRWIDDPPATAQPGEGAAKGSDPNRPIWLGFSPDCSRLISEDRYGTLRVLDCESGEPILTTRIPETWQPPRGATKNRVGVITGCVFLPGVLRVASGGHAFGSPTAPVIEPLQIWDIALPPSAKKGPG